MFELLRQNGHPGAQVPGYTKPSPRAKLLIASRKAGLHRKMFIGHLEVTAATPIAGNTASSRTPRSLRFLSNADERSSIWMGSQPASTIQRHERFIRSLLRQHWQRCRTGKIPGKQRGPARVSQSDWRPTSHSGPRVPLYTQVSKCSTCKADIYCLLN